MFVADHHTLEQLQDLAQAIPQKRLWRRVQAVVLAQQGRTAQDIALAQLPQLRQNITDFQVLFRRNSLFVGPSSGRTPM